jgi:hypothetical protein
MVAQFGRMSSVHLDEFPTLKLGKTDARHDAVALKLVNYLPSTLPAHPTTFGHYGMVPDYPILANDQYGCCVWAGAAHEHQIMVAEGKGSVTFADRQILAAYSAVTGFSPDDPSTDQGTDMVAAANYRRKTGIQDTASHMHTVAAYAALDVGDDNQVETAAWLFGAVGVGWQLPKSAMLQFQDGKPWKISRSNTEILGGHYVPIVGADADWLYGITWAKVIPIDRKFLRKYMDEGLAYLSTEILWGGKSLENFTATQLLGDLRGITTVRTPAPSAIAGTANHRDHVHVASSLSQFSNAGRTPPAPRQRARREQQEGGGK